METLKDRLPLPRGFQVAGTAAGIKKGTTKDMALLFSEQPATAAGTFTTNRVKAAPVLVSQRNLADGSARAVIVNSGNANCCTGTEGLINANKMAELTAIALAVKPEEITVCSTGHIGDQLPMEPISAGIQALAKSLQSDDARTAAEAIMTTDLVPKWAERSLVIDGKTVRITAIAKGSGMIEPNMATMLCFIMTDAAIGAEQLQSALSTAVEQSFNRITVDGDMSTNDSVIMLANGQAENKPLTPDHSDWPAWCEALNSLCLDLAKMMVHDGEGATKFVTLHVAGALTNKDAETVARAVGNSLLVKTSWVRRDANWGRLMDAIGYSKAPIEPEKINIFYGDLPAVVGGLAAKTKVSDLEDIVANPEFSIRIDLGLGNGETVVYTCDCTEAYVRINY